MPVHAALSRVKVRRGGNRACPTVIQWWVKKELSTVFCRVNQHYPPSMSILDHSDYLHGKGLEGRGMTLSPCDVKLPCGVKAPCGVRVYVV